MLSIIRSWLSRVFTPPAIPSTDSLMSETEEEIEAGAQIVEDNIRAGWVRKARQFVGQGKYCLGAGGKDPKAAVPWSKCAKPATHNHEHLGAVFCDCSGFVDFVLGWSRNDPVY